MMLPILAIRPEPGCSATVAAGKAVGIEIVACPLQEIRGVSWAIPSGHFDGLLLGSANALRRGGELVDKLVDKPVYAVGETTAQAARKRGFDVARTGEGGLQSLLDGLAGNELRLLRLTGSEMVTLSPPAGIAIETAITYESIGLPITGDAEDMLQKRAVVLLHSAGAANHFVAECERVGVHRSDILLAALSERIANAAGTGWAALRWAAKPNEPALLALARDMCHDLRRE